MTFYNKRECRMCPRQCGADRVISKGICGCKDSIYVARAALHMWEEPCISGDKGSGTVFFSGCPLGCVFCQNSDISDGKIGKEITISRLAEIFLELQAQGANNINLVTPTHYLWHIKQALMQAKRMGLGIPVVYNCGGYESVESLQQLEGLIDIYLPDMKYMSPELAKRYSRAENYPQVAKAAIKEMYRQVGANIFDENGIMTKGIIVRHLVMPEAKEDSKAVVKYLYDTYKDNIYMSIMSQYTPMQAFLPGGRLHMQYPELGNKIKWSDYDEIIDYALELGVENAFIQEDDVAEESFIPDFTKLEGV